MTTDIVLAVGLIVGFALLALNIREILYLRSSQKRLDSPSWLIDALLQSTNHTAAVSLGFLVLFLVRILWGIQPWSAWASVLLIMDLLLIPVLRGIEIRRHDV